MRGVSVRVWILTALALCMLLPALASAQTGKIAGVVKDADTGEPIAGANVKIEGMSRGAAADLDGKFFILAVPPGTYDIRASSVGYSTLTLQDVVVNIDRTTNLTIELKSSTLQLKEVTVVYKKPEVEIGVTSNVSRITSEDLSMLPSNDVNTALLATPGFKMDQEGKIHIRGGRDTEARFIVDGIDTRDPITGESLPLNLSSINVQEIQILTGGMAAEYGQAQSGYVTISTPEGAPDRYNGSVTWETDAPFGKYSFNEDQLNAATGGPVPFTKMVMGRPLTFYVTVNGQMNNTADFLGKTYGNQDYLGVGIPLPRRQYNDWGTSLKLAYDMGSGRKVSAFLSKRSVTWDLYGRGAAGLSPDYGWQYKHDLANLPMATDNRTSYNVEYTDQVSERTVLNMSVGRSLIDATIEPRRKTPGEITLESQVEENINGYINSSNDINHNGRWDQDPDGDGVIHSSVDELANDADQNNFLDGFYDANRTGAYEGGNEGYEDLNMNGEWDRGEDWIDLNGNGVYDYAEPWTDRTDPVTGQNNVGVWDPWDPYVDLNGNGVWDPAEPQLPEQDTNGNGRWDGERFQDANGNGIFDRWEPFTDLNGDFKWEKGEPFVDKNGNGKQDDGEGYDDENDNGKMDRRDLINNETEDMNEPFWDGDVWNDTGEPFTDLPDPLTGEYNGVWDEGEPFVDLPTSNMQATSGSNLGLFLGTPTLNGRYDPPNGQFDEFELFTFWTGDKTHPIGYTYDPNQHGSDWVYTDYMAWQENHSTWVNRTIDDVNPDNPTDKSLWRFDPPNYVYDVGKEKFVDYNGNGVWNGQDLFLNPNRWDQADVWSHRKTDQYFFKFSWQSQVNDHHEVKTGTEINYYIMNQEYIEQPDQPYTGQAAVSPGEPWPTRGAVRDFWEYRPLEGAVYLQDKMEFEGLIVQAGVRSDFIVHDKKVVDEQRRRFLAGEPGAVLAKRSQIEFAPRLGISHPITAQSKLYFNYGHFYQLPSFTYYYKSTTTNVNQGIVGNPNLKFQKTVTYELGVQTQITEDFTAKVAGYYRDLYNLISTVSKRESGITIYQYVNLDYGRMRGFELSLEKKYSHHYQVTLNYDFSYAYGKASGVNDEFVRRALNVPVNYDEHPLNWDETHRITINGAINYMKGDYPVLFGFRLPDYWLMSFQWQFGSGMPYTPSQWSTGMNPNLILPNSARMPWTETTSVRFEKYFDAAGIKWIAGVEVYNLFNKTNVNQVYAETGSPDVAIHPLDPDYNPFLNRTEYDHNPRYYGPGRQIMLKVGMEF